MALDHYHNKNHVLNEYKDDSTLKKRKLIFEIAVPKINIIEEVSKCIDFKNTKNILDIGCGNGDLLIHIRKSGFSGNLVGLDISEGIMKPGIDQNKREKLDIKFDIGTAENLPFEKESFDVIIAKHMIYHVPNMQKCVDEAYRCLKPSGKFIVTLNSGSTRPLLNKIIAEASKKANIDRLSHERRLTTETFPPLTKDFQNIEFKKFNNEIILEDPQIYIDYLDACRNLLNKVITDEEWMRLMKEAKIIIKNIIENEGKLVEYNSFGIFVCRK